MKKLIKSIVDDFLTRHLRLSNDPDDVGWGEDTALYIDGNLWNFGYSDLVGHWLNDDINNDSEFNVEFIKKIYEYYGIDDREVIQIIYKEIVVEMIKRVKEFLKKNGRFLDYFGDPINESIEDKKDRFYEFIVNDFVERMNIHDGKATMWFDNGVIRDYNGYRRHPHPYDGVKNDIFDGYRFNFNVTMQKIYGITKHTDLIQLWYKICVEAAWKITRSFR